MVDQALADLGLDASHEIVTTPAPEPGPIIRSTGASTALDEADPACLARLEACDLLIDLSIEGLMHARQTSQILKSGTRIQNISHEHPDVLTRMAPRSDDKDRVKNAVNACRQASRMKVTSAAGTSLDINMEKSATVGVWGWTDRPGTLAHWPGGLVVSFPQANSVNGTLVLAPGDLNLTFKRYLESPVTLTIENDYVTAIEGDGADGYLMRSYLAGFDDKEAYATSHVGWGVNPRARYEALAMYDKQDINGTELRALAGNFLYSTGANEFAGRFTRGHFDLPVMNCDIYLDDKAVVLKGVLQGDESPGNAALKT